MSYHLVIASLALAFPTLLSLDITHSTQKRQSRSLLAAPAVLLFMMADEEDQEEIGDAIVSGCCCIMCMVGGIPYMIGQLPVGCCVGCIRGCNNASQDILNGDYNSTKYYVERESLKSFNTACKNNCCHLPYHCSHCVADYVAYKARDCCCCCKNHQVTQPQIQDMEPIAIAINNSTFNAPA